MPATNPGRICWSWGSVHGNEKCGTIAINRIIPEIQAGKINITRGRVTFVPIANPRAYELDKRFVERNLNRYLVPMEKPNCYEAELGNILCPMLQTCDVLLDLHSYTAGGPPFVFVGMGDEDGHAFASALGDVTLMTGWQQAYAATGRNKTETDKNESIGTTEYARLNGATAVTLECGQHKDPRSAEIGYQAIRNALVYLDIVESPHKAVPRPATLVTVTHFFYKDDEGSFPKEWKHLQAVKKNEALAHRANSEAIVAPDNGFIIMPHAGTPLGQEWFYFGVEKT